jgi:hypothetical protein
VRWKTAIDFSKTMLANIFPATASQAGMILIACLTKNGAAYR